MCSCNTKHAAAEIQGSACFFVPVYRLCVRCVHSRIQAGLSEDLASDGCINHSDLLGISDGLKGAGFSLKWDMVPFFFFYCCCCSRITLHYF